MLPSEGKGSRFEFWQGHLNFVKLDKDSFVKGAISLFIGRLLFSWSAMNKSRIEAFSDGVLAIVITIMVLKLAAPEGASLTALKAIAPTFFSYILSFVFIGIYWNNHHHLLQAVEVIDGRILWANLHLLLWLSLIPFVTAWMGDTMFAAWPTALYGINLLLAAIAYFILVRALLARHGEGSLLASAVDNDFKGKISLVIYAVAIPLAFVSTWLAGGRYILVAIMWLIPDRRIESLLTQ